MERKKIKFLEAVSNQTPLTRELDFNIRAAESAINEEERTVEIAFSSDTPYRRWDGFEILGHEPGEIDLSRFKNKAPLLWMHDWYNQIGVIEKVEIDSANGVGRCVVRFSKTEDASKYFDDVVDGIITKVSVGYMVLKWIDVTEDGDEIESYRVILWQPYEVSFVSVAADDDVGVGRSLQLPPGHEKTPEEKPEDENNLDSSINQKTNKRTPKMPEETETTTTVDLDAERSAANKKGRDAGREAEQKRVKEIRNITRQYGIDPEEEDKFLEEGKTPDEYVKRVLDIMQERSNGGKDKDGKKKKSTSVAEMGDPNIGMTEKEVNSFSFVRLINALCNPNTRSIQEEAKFELEMAEAAAEKKNGNVNRGMTIPFDVLCAPVGTSMGQRMARVAQRYYKERIVSTTTPVGGPGSNLIATDLLAGSFIDLLTNRTTAMQLGFVLSGLVGNIDIPRQSGGGTGYWLGEDDQVTESDQEFDQVSLTPKTAGARTAVTRKMLQQSSIDIEALIRFDIARTLSLLIDLAFYYGTGAANQPTGITNQVGINTVDFVGLNPTYPEVVQMETEIAADNADVMSMAYVLAATMRGHLKTTEKFSGSNGQPIWEQGNQVNGYRTEVTNQIAANDIVFGNFMDAIIGMWGGLDMIVDPYTNSDRGRVNITSFQDVDFNLRHPESFCHGKQFTP